MGPTIFDYSDFRKFLADWQQAKVGEDASYSKSNVSRMLGLPNTRSYFSDILAGKKLTSTFVERLIPLVGLEGDEAKFFRILVDFNQADSADAREMCFDQLVSFKRTPKRMVVPREYDYYRHWYHGAVRALLGIMDIDDDHGLLASRICPPISRAQARESMELLSALDLIARNSEGFWKPTDKSIGTGSYVNDPLIRQFQLQCLNQARDIIAQGTPYAHNISTNLMGLSLDAVRRIEKRLQQFKKEVRTIVHKDEHVADRVYQMTITLLPTGMGDQV